MAVRDFIVVGSSAMRRAASELEAQLAAWSRKWGASGARFEITPRSLEATPREEVAWLALPSGRWAHLPGSFEQRVRESVASGASSGSIAERVAYAGWNAFQDEILGGTGGPVGEPPSSLFARGSGAIELGLTLDGVRARLLMPHMGGRKLAPAASSRNLVHPREQLVQGMPVELRAQLATVDMPADSLHRLSVGDVILLGSPLESAAEVVGPDGERLFRGYLCAHRGMRALDLLADSKLGGK